MKTSAVSSAGAVEVRRRLGEMLDDAEKRGGSFIIRRVGHEVAALVPIERYRQLERQRRSPFALIDRVRQRTRSVPEKTLRAEISAAVVYTASNPARFERLCR